MNISTIYIYITRLASKEIFSPSNKINRGVGRAKDLSAPLYLVDICHAWNKGLTPTIQRDISVRRNGFHWL